MNIHEHQAKGLLRKFGVLVPDGYPAFTVEDAVTKITLDESNGIN